MSTPSAPPTVSLTAARYGKDKVRVFRIVRSESDQEGGGHWHDVGEYEVCALVEGEIETSFTQADNSVVVATDSSASLSLSSLICGLSGNWN